MGAIIYWGLVRFALVLLGTWFLFSTLPDTGEWWTVFVVGVAAVVIYPAQLAYHKQQQLIVRARRNELCVQCKHFVEESTLCAILDEHVSASYTPCHGEAWEPISLSEL